METTNISINLSDCTEFEANTFIKEGLLKKHKMFFDTWMKDHVDHLISNRLSDFLKGHPKIDALCSIQSNKIIEDCKE